jgi:hypothetical protein
LYLEVFVAMFWTITVQVRFVGKNKKK